MKSLKIKHVRVLELSVENQAAINGGTVYNTTPSLPNTTGGIIGGFLVTVQVCPIIP